MAKRKVASAKADRRSAKQDVAIGEGMASGALPPGERRADVPDLLSDTEQALASAGVGSVFEKAQHGWNVKLVEGGTTIHVQGATIPDAIGSHGKHVVHPKSREQLAREGAAE